MNMIVINFIIYKNRHEQKKGPDKTGPFFKIIRERNVNLYSIKINMKRGFSSIYSKSFE